MSHRQIPVDSKTPSPPSASTSSDISGKIKFVVQNTLDGKRYKVFLRATDLKKLRVGKIRRAISQMAGLDESTFELEDERGVMLFDDQIGASFGLCENSVLRLCPRPPHACAEDRDKGEGAGSTSYSPASINGTGTYSHKMKRPLVVDVYKENEPTAPQEEVRLSRAQRELQEQLWHEAHQAKSDGLSPLPLQEIVPISSPIETEAHQRAEAVQRHFGDCAGSRTPGLDTESHYQCDMFPRLQPYTATASTSPVALDTSATAHLSTLSRHELMQQWNKETQEMLSAWQADRDQWKHEKETLMKQLSSAAQSTRCNQQAACPPLHHKHRTSIQEGAVGHADNHFDYPEDHIVAQSFPEEEKIPEEVWYELLSRNSSLRSQCECFQQELMDLRTHSQKATEENVRLHQKLSASMTTLQKMKEKVAVEVFNGDRAAGAELVDTTYKLNGVNAENTRLQQERDKLLGDLEKEKRRRCQLHAQLEEFKGNIRVMVRMRPPISTACPKAIVNPGEEANTGLPFFDSTAIEIDEWRNTVSVTNPTSATGGRLFEFYRVAGAAATQSDIFREVEPLLESAVDGYNVCILAYGQTGSGKTYTISGDYNSKSSALNSAGAGLLPRSCEVLFSLLDAFPNDGMTYQVHCSMVELYNETFSDMLAASQQSGVGGEGGENVARCEIRQTPTGAVVVGASRVAVRCPADVLSVLNEGSQKRQVHKTKQNPTSSRSHAIFSIHLNVNFFRTQTTTSSVLTFVDLAGSERVAKSQSTGYRLKEAQYINKSLSALGDVVAALSKRQGMIEQMRGSGIPSHVPYRNSKLTLLLQDCIGGNAKTLLVACIAPNALPYECNTSETVSTLTFASRVKCVRNGIVRSGLSLKQEIITGASSTTTENQAPPPSSAATCTRPASMTTTCNNRSPSATQGCHTPGGTKGTPRASALQQPRFRY